MGPQISIDLRATNGGFANCQLISSGL